MSRMMNDVMTRPRPMRPPLPKVEVKKTKQRIKLSLDLPRLSFKRFNPRKPLHIALVALIVTGTAAPIAGVLWTNAKYSLTPRSQSLLATPSSKYQAKYDDSAKAFIFSSDPGNVAGQSAEVGGSGFKATFPSDASKGVTIHDNSNDLSVNFAPLGGELDARTQRAHIVYPASSQPAQTVYTLKANGVKEDILLAHPVGDSFTQKYRLNLGKDLEPRLMPTGALGVYSADPALTASNISYGSDADRQLMDKARANAPKDHLAFVVPEPVVHQSPGGGGVSAKFSLDGNVLTVTATGLNEAAYPLSIDPSFVVTSISDFQTGNAEDNINFDSTNNQISRQPLTGGTLQSFATGTGTMALGVRDYGLAVANGYAYTVGGGTVSSVLATVQFAKINNNGTFGAWATTTSLPAGRSNPAVTAYNGYIYAFGGTATGGASQVNGYYAKPNPDGTIPASGSSTWATATNSLPSGADRDSASMVAYNGYLYMLGGCPISASTCLNTNIKDTTYYSKINPDGTNQAWSTGSTLPYKVTNASAAVYNGRVYLVGGFDSTGARKATTVYATFNSDGSLGTWQTASNSFAAARQYEAAVVYGGYLYSLGGNIASSPATTSTTYYAPIMTDGSLGAWSTTSTLVTTRSDFSAISANGYIFAIGGFDGSSPVNTYESAKADTPGQYQTFNTTTSMGSSAMMDAVASGYGYLYSIGGCTASPATSAACTAAVTTVRVGTIAGDGSLTWTTTTVLPAGRWFAQALVYNGYLYVAGGCTTLAGSCVGKTDIIYAPITITTGQIGSWSTATAALNANTGQAFSFIGYDDALYVLGGHTTGSSTNSTEVDYYPLSGTTGDLATRNQTTSLPGGSATTDGIAFGYGGRIYQSTGGSTISMDTVNSDGSLGVSWSTATSSLPAGSGVGSGALGAVMVYKGYLYTSSNVHNYYASFNSDGTINTLTALNSNSVARQAHAVVLSGDHVYIYGGCTNQTNYSPGSESCTGSSTTVETTTINNGGTGVLNTWKSTTALADPDGVGTKTAARLSPALVATNGCLYVLGGAEVSGNFPQSYNDVQAAPINADGSIGSWTATTSLPFTDGRGRAVAYGNYIYAYAGSAGVGTTVYYGLANSNCTVSSWIPTSVSNNAHVVGGFAAYNGYLYLVDSVNTSPAKATEYAKINANGSLNGWINGPSTNNNHGEAPLVAYGGYLYILGGCADNGSNICKQAGDTPNSVESAQIGSDGSIGSWKNTVDIPRGGIAGAAYALNGFIYVVNGRNDNSGINIQQLGFYAAILPGGQLGNWQQAVGRSVNGYWMGWTIYNGYFYMGGGTDGGADVANVDYTSTNSIARIGRYSKLMDAGNDVIAAKLWLAGTSINGHPSLTYKTSTSAANSFGSSLGVNLLSIGQMNILPSGDSTARYYQMLLTLDDSAAAVFPDSVGGSTTIADLIFYFHPAPFNRLRGGKTLGPQGCNFNGGSSCQLDATP